MKKQNDWHYCEVSQQPTIILVTSFGEKSHCVAVAIDQGAAIDVQELRNKTVDNDLDKHNQ